MDVTAIGALALDLLLGEPPARLHPTVWMGTSLGRARAERRSTAPVDSLIEGAWVMASRVAVTVLAAGLADVSLSRAPRILRIPLRAAALKPALSLRALLDAATTVQLLLESGRLAAARRALGRNLVSRDTSALSASEVAGAAIESVAENFSDSVVGPLLAFRAGGLPTAYAYRLINTADAMFGYRIPELEWFGKPAARLDDVMNLMPARIAALLVVTTARAGGGSSRRAARVTLRDAGRTASPNAGWPMAAMAGALDVQLTKRGVYSLHDEGRSPVAHDIGRSCRARCGHCGDHSHRPDMIAPRNEVLATDPAIHGGRYALTAAVRHDFSVCLNAFGPAPTVLRAIAEAGIDEYPDPHARAPRRAAAERFQRPMDEIVFGAGVAELIHVLCFAFLRPGDKVIIAAPAFGEYARSAVLCGARLRQFAIATPTGADETACERFLIAVIEQRPRVVFITTPVSPTGTSHSTEFLHRLAGACAAVGALLAIDQAYDAFLETPLGTPILPGHTNVVHLRSLTKDHSLAGVRVAFAVAPPSVAEAMERVRVPWPTSVAAQAAAVAALGDAASAHATRTTAELRREAVRIAERCTARGMQISNSETHFFTLRCSDVLNVSSRLLADHDILVRDCASFGLPGWIRVAARTPAENDVLIDALANLADRNRQL